MSTLAINSENDIYFDSAGKLVTISGTNSDNEILQRIKIRLRFFKDEWFLNSQHGMPYFQDVLGAKNLDLNIVEGIFREQILDIEGVKELIESSINYDPADRKVNYFFKALSINNSLITDNLIVI